MPPIQVLTYQEAEGDVPLHDWLREIGADSRDAAARCRDLIQRLADQGHALRRPSSAPLRDDMHELRARVGRVNYRIIYFFNGRGVAVLTSGCTKEGEVEDADIDRAVRYKTKFRADPERHTYRPPQPKTSAGRSKPQQPRKKR
jgi:hypothetical protein